MPDEKYMVIPRVMRAQPWQYLWGQARGCPALHTDGWVPDLLQGTAECSSHLGRNAGELYLRKGKKCQMDTKNGNKKNEKISEVSPAAEKNIRYRLWAAYIQSHSTLQGWWWWWSQVDLEWSWAWERREKRQCFNDFLFLLPELIMKNLY